MSRNRLTNSAGLRPSRRRFLQSAAAGTIAASDMTFLNVLRTPALADELHRQQKRVILLWLAGGASQLETWDPKPGAPTGGPFAKIATDVPGVEISELLPQLAQRMKHTAVIRSLNTRNGDHGAAYKLMETGRVAEAGVEFPHLGAVLARELGRADSQVPDYVTMYSSTEGRSRGTAGYLGARYGEMFLTDQMIPENLRRLDSITPADHADRAALRQMLADRFSRGLETPAVNSQNSAYQRVRGLMSSDHLFDIEREPADMRARYGPTQFGQQCLIARRLSEAGTPFVKVARAWWDSHGQNFETHRELCADLDHSMSVLLDDLNDRGLLESTLVITLGEFGRTPHINGSLGRDHFASAWSCTLGGCGIKGGSVYGKTDPKGETVIEGEIGAADLFATILKAVGIEHDKEYMLGARPIPLSDFGSEPVDDVLG
jgi:uncharacterized protein (DUF1501 family)